MATSDRVLRWSYALGDDRCECELTLNPEHGLYELRLRDGVSPRVRLDHFVHVNHALIQQCEYEAQLLAEGYSLQAFEAAAASAMSVTQVPAPTPHVVIVNSSPDTCEMLQAYFEGQGWTASYLLTRQLRSGEISPQNLINTGEPDVIVFDVALPYEEGWSVLQTLRSNPHVTCPIVVTTTNEAVVRRLTGTHESLLEIVGKPYDLRQLFEAVLAAVHGGTPTPRDRDSGDRRHGDRRTGERRSHMRRRSTGSRPV